MRLLKLGLYPRQLALQILLRGRKLLRLRLPLGQLRRLTLRFLNPSLYLRQLALQIVPGIGELLRSRLPLGRLRRLALCFLKLGLYPRQLALQIIPGTGELLRSRLPLGQLGLQRNTRIGQLAYLLPPDISIGHGPTLSRGFLLSQT